MKQYTKDMIKTLKKIAKKHNLRIEYQKFKTYDKNGKKIKTICYKLFDPDVEERYNLLANKQEKLPLFILPVVAEIVMTYTITNDIGDNYFEFTPDDLTKDIFIDFNKTLIHKITTEEQFDLKYKAYKERFEDYYTKYDLAMKQKMVQNALNRADSDFNDNKPDIDPDDFFNRLANM